MATFRTRTGRKAKFRTRTGRDWATNRWVPHISRQDGRWSVDWFPLLDEKLQKQVRQAIEWARLQNHKGR